MSYSSSSLAPDVSPQAAEDEVLPMETGGWSYRVALLFLALYYIRPQDWVPGMAGMNVIRPVMLIWGVAMLAEGLQSPLRGFFRTAHDWAMLAFYIYIVWNAPGEAGAASGMFSLVIFYYLTTQSLSSWGNLLGYLRLWTWLLIILAVLGVLQTMGIDITGGKHITESGKGRLALGTWICDNSNALGHTLAAGIPLSYMMFFWRRGGLSRLVLFPSAIALILTCIWYTQSKGSFLVGAGLLVLLFVVGRPKWIQMIVLVTAMTAGVGALSFMPRMERMGSLRSDEGVMGRLMAWEKAREAVERSTTGAGWKQFQAWITFREGNLYITEWKSTHSSYVQIGGDLGKPGLCLWLLVLTCSYRGVLFHKAANDEEERCRRSIILILTAYMASSWMINREYHTEYYLIAAIAAAFCRLSTARMLQPDAEGESEEGGVPKKPEWSLPTYELAPWLKPDEGGPATVTRKLWLRPDWIDLLAACVGTWLVLYIWDYILKNL